MYLQGSGSKMDSRKHMEHTGFSSFLSRHLPRYGYHQYHTDSSRLSSQLAQSFNLKSMVPCFDSHRSTVVCDIMKTTKQLDYRKINSYSQISSMNILSYLVGGFVGSKSQIGCSSMNGSKLQIWDFVMEKLIEIMSNQIVCSEELGHQSVNLENNPDSFNKDIRFEDSDRKTNASVIKMNPNLKCSDENIESSTMKFDSRRTRRRGRRKQNSADCSSNKQVNFEKKVSSQDRNYFSSSRWSSTRKKHGKKGIEKLNRREKMEAAKDGIDFINQELDRDPQTHQNLSHNRPCITDRIMEKLQMKAVEKFESSSSVPHRHKKSSPSLVNNCDSNSGKSNFDKEKDCDRQQLMACKMKLDCEYASMKKRANSESSVESEDSFIVFDYTDADSLSCFSIDSDSSSECEDSDICSTLLCSTCVIYANTKCCDDISSHISAEPSSRKTMVCLICKKQRIEDFDELSSYNDRGYSSPNSSMTSKNSFLLNCMSIRNFEDSSNRNLRLLDISPESNGKNLKLCSLVDEKSSSNSLGPAFQSTDLSADCDSDYQFDQLPIYEEHPCSGNSYLYLLNKNWRQLFCDNNNQPRKRSKEEKKVSFAPDNRLASVKTMRAWDYALRSARIGPWEELARDSMRFVNRITRTEEILKPILSDDHRAKIWHERFKVQISD